MTIKKTMLLFSAFGLAGVVLTAQACSKTTTEEIEETDDSAIFEDVSDSTSILADENLLVMDALAYSPSVITVSAGSIVTVRNSDTVIHTADVEALSVASGDINPGEETIIQFSEPGTYQLTCRYHPEMTATVIVE
jgi:plastocyanin